MTCDDGHHGCDGGEISPSQLNLQAGIESSEIIGKA